MSHTQTKLLHQQSLALAHFFLQTEPKGSLVSAATWLAKTTAPVCGADGAGIRLHWKLAQVEKKRKSEHNKECLPLICIKEWPWGLSATLSALFSQIRATDLTGYRSPGCTSLPVPLTWAQD